MFITSRVFCNLLYLGFMSLFARAYCSPYIIFPFVVFRLLENNKKGLYRGFFLLVLGFSIYTLCFVFFLFNSFKRFLCVANENFSP